METLSNQITALIESQEAVYNAILSLEAELQCEIISDRFDHATSKGSAILNRNGDVSKVQYSELYGCYTIDNVYDLN
jgi:hypothetical protein